jgi:hypothetical protein
MHYLSAGLLTALLEKDIIRHLLADEKLDRTVLCDWIVTLKDDALVDDKGICMCVLEV